MKHCHEDFCSRLAYLMKDAGVDVITLAKFTGIKPQSVAAILEGKVSPTIEEIDTISAALRTTPSSLFLKNGNILDRLNISVEDFQWSMENNPSLRGVVIGYIAELKLRAIFEGNPDVTRIFKYDDHDRKKKSDLIVEYKGRQFSLEVKSLQTNLVREETKPSGEKIMTGKCQCDASDCRDIVLPDGQEVRTTLLKYGDFDVLAVNLFAFFGKWQYAFALNSKLPHSTSKKYTESQQEQLISSLIPITYPVQEPFVLNPFELFDEI